MTVELRWQGKYDAEGRKSAPLRVKLPFQTVETVNQSAQERITNLFRTTTDWRNRLIWGDKRYVLPALLDEFAGKVNLIYIDPPFATGANFNFTYEIEVEGEQFTKQPSMIEEKAYRDTWGKGLDSYLQWFYETAVLLRELLHENGSIYVHLDWHVGHYAKAVMDEVFGSDKFLSEIVWVRTSSAGSSKAISKKFPSNHDVIFFYSKGGTFHYERQYKPYTEEYLKRFKYDDNNGRGLYRIDNLSTFSKTTFEQLKAENRIIIPKTAGANYGYKRYLNETKGIVIDDVWTDINFVNPMASENLDYPTQKPEVLLERIIKASSNRGDLVLDCFCGSGTTAAVAEKLGRRWITCDLGRFAIHTARKRLLSIADVKPFDVQNLGKYERQQWQKQSFGENAERKIDAYIGFILELYNAQPLSQFGWLHGLKSGKVVHVGAVDSPVTAADVRAIILEWRKNFGSTGATQNTIEILGWDFALDTNETVKQQAAEAGVTVTFKRIPREVLEQKAVEQGDIHFYELAALFEEIKIEKKTLTVSLKNFIAPRDYVPKEIEEKIGAERWDAWIDYWAIDFDHKGDAFHNQWQSYRTRKNKKLELSASHTYDQAGKYTVQIKVIDILGNDTTKTIEVEVK